MLMFGKSFFTLGEISSILQMSGKFLLPTFFFIFQEGEDPENPNEAVEENCSVLSRTPSSRLLSRSRPSSFRTISLEPLSPVPSIRHQPQRTKSFKRNRYVMYVRLSQKSKKLEYQKSLLTLDLGWSNKLSCKILAFYLENRKSGDHLKF